MPDFDALVTDTHPLLFHAAGGTRLSRLAKAHFQACERQEAILYIPVVVIWESFLLARARKVEVLPTPERFFTALFSNPAYQPVPLTPEQVYLAESFRLDRDPFDALISAAASSLGLPLLTRDGAIEESGLEVVW
jgi:PIN domain nuclease of toxin-antitoxin system